MHPYLVQRTVEHRRQQLRLHGLVLRIGDGQRPFLFLSRRQLVAESRPFQIQCFVWQRLSYALAVRIQVAFANPCAREQHAIAILLLILELASCQRVALIHRSALQHFIAREQRIDHMLVLIRRTELYFH